MRIKASMGTAVPIARACSCVRAISGARSRSGQRLRVALAFNFRFLSTPQRNARAMPIPSGSSEDAPRFPATSTHKRLGWGKGLRRRFSTLLATTGEDPKPPKIRPTCRPRQARHRERRRSGTREPRTTLGGPWSTWPAPARPSPPATKEARRRFRWPRPCPFEGWLRPRPRPHGHQHGEATGPARSWSPTR